MQPIVIIGSGLAGYTVAREFRKLDAETPITLICADSGDFYSKPMLSNAFAQNKSPAQLVTTPAAEMVRQLNISMMARTTVDKIDSQGHRVYTNQGSISYSKLVLAVGATPVRADIGGDAAADVLSVNQLEDYSEFYQRLGAPPRNVVIIGGGLIGCEFANDLIKGGHRVTVVHPHHYPLHTLVPEQTGQSLEAALAHIGVQWKLRDTVQAVNNAKQGYRVTLSSGEEIEADIVLSAIGLRPNLQLVQHSDIVARRGIVVDDYLQTNVADIFALGDCAEYGDRTLPYVMPIMNAARALAKTLAGTPTAVTFPYMPVVVKTPSLPLVVQPPPVNAAGHWQAEEQSGLKMHFVDRDGQLRGFVLAGEYTKERAKYLTKLPPLAS